MLGFLKKVFGTKYDKDVKAIQPYVDEANSYFKQYNSLSHDDLRNKTLEFRQKIADYLADIDQELENLQTGAMEEEDLSVREEIYRAIDELKKERDKKLEEVLMDILPEAFAVVKETARRFSNNEELRVTATQLDKDLAAANKDFVSIEGNDSIWKNSWLAAGGEITWNMVHYDVQLIGGYVLHTGKVAEMQTGEGKTLVATLPAYLNGLSGQGVHVITVNNYLATRDCEWVGPIFQFLHLTVDCIDKYKPHTPERVAAYGCDITYGTNNEFGFDYLRDNMVRSLEEKVQKKHHFAMIDEVDSVLIDDARTPLIISGPVPAGTEEQEYQTLKPKVERLISTQKKMATDYLASAKKLFKEGNSGFEEGDCGMALLRAYRSLPKYRPLIKFLSEEGVKATLQKAENYYMQEQSKNMHLVDAELLFVIDEKNRSVELTDKGVESMSKGENDTSFFVMPDIASEMQALEEQTASGNDMTEAKAALIQDYSIKSRRLHAVNQLLKAYTLFEKEEEYVVIDGQVKIVDEQTGRMMEGRRYSDGLHQALEAKENVKVGDITQTYATITLQNYFRMYHKLAGMTGTAETEASELWEIYKLDVVVIPTNRPIVRDDMEDLVYKTAREKFNAVIDDIQKLTSAGRPVLVGTTTVDVSEKLSRMLNLRGIKHNVLNAKQHQREAEIVSMAGQPGAVTIATNMAGRGTDIKINDAVKQAGGLAIIATERHDSRRVDRQLRGRAGRQGDPGSSQFYVSLEDKLMRLFNSDRISKVMDTLGHQEGEVIQHSMITKSIERAQKKVEENNFGIRKRLLEYDDVMNIQREAIYNKRNNALSGQRLSVDLYNMIMSLTESLVEDHKAGGDYSTFRNDSLRILSIEPNIAEADFTEGNLPDLVHSYQQTVLAAYEKKSDQVTEMLLPIIKKVFENEGHRYKRISVPYVSSSREKPLPIAADLELAVNSEGETIMKDIEKAITLALIDENWKEHLRSMDELKDSVQAASFEQKDPLVVYKMEAYNSFEELVYKVNYDVMSYLMGGKLMIAAPEDVREAKQKKTDFKSVRTSREQQARQRAAMSAGRQQQAKPETFKRTEKKVKRNDPCPCGSGKKYKQCHGK